ncbi:MAG: hypothetical protein HY303_17045 [Candidatus Wallbacteria bacterium]|nr:hypothetical protein [Candidatus Wallbacteria bacterium]
MNKHGPHSRRLMAILAALAALVAPLAASPSARLEVVGGTVAPGGTIQIRVLLKNLATPELVTARYELRYDARLLGFVHAKPGAATVDTGKQLFFNGEQGVVWSTIAGTLDPLPDGELGSYWFAVSRSAATTGTPILFASADASDVAPALKPLELAGGRVEISTSAPGRGKLELRAGLALVSLPVHPADPKELPTSRGLLRTLGAHWVARPAPSCAGGPGGWQVCFESCGPDFLLEAAGALLISAPGDRTIELTGVPWPELQLRKSLCGPLDALGFPGGLPRLTWQEVASRTGASRLWATGAADPGRRALGEVWPQARAAVPPWEAAGCLVELQGRREVDLLKLR